MSEELIKLQLIGKIAEANNKNLELIEELNDREDEIERLTKELELIEELNDRKDEIERLNNIIKEVREYIEENEYSFIDKHGNSQDISQFLELLDKGSDEND